MTLPVELVQFFTTKHGELKDGHPNYSISSHGGAQHRHALSLANSTTDSVARSHRLNNSRPESVDVTVQTSEADSQYIIVSFVGGARCSHNISAYVCCVWTNANDLAWWLVLFIPASFGDSAVIINLALARYRVSAQNLVPILQEIRRLLFGLRLVVLSAVPLAFNTAADGLCNWIMDKAVDKIQSLSADSTAWPLPPSVSSRPIQLDCPQVPNQSSVSADHSHWGRCWAILMADYKRVEHLVQNNFVNHAYNESSLPDIAEPDTAAPYADTTARCESSPFDSNVSTSAP
ncbi:hypothetical protein GQ600_24480 [Phytophthora cactorum]|nr:hypothetical protein GQ600_24480 [Phytophthora cactorum]